MKHFVCVVLILLTVSVTSFASPSINTERASVRAERIERTSSSLRLTLAFEQPTWETVPVDGATLFRARYEGEPRLGAEGQADVPVVSQLVRIPVSGEVLVEVTHAKYETLSDVDYAAWNGNREGQPLVSPLASTEDRWYPQDLATISDPAVLRDFRIATLRTMPVQVNPARREVRVCTALDLTITTDSAPSENDLPAWPTQISRNFLSAYRQLLDWDESELDDYEVTRGSIQVVTTEEALPSLESWIEWKRQKGWLLDFLTPENVPEFTSTAIRAELQTRYQEMESPFDIIVVVGDAVGAFAVPPAGQVGGADGDLLYACLVGQDDVPDVAIGRISVETPAELVGYSNKAVYYEKTTTHNESDWYRRGVVAAGSASSGTSTILLGHYARNLMLEHGYTQVDTIWWNDGFGNIAPRIAERINDGVSFYSYRGWLVTGLQNEDIAALNNPYKQPFVLDIECGTGTWSTATSRTETWMRTGTPTVPRGGIGAIGIARTSSHTRHNNALSAGAIQSVFGEDNPLMGMAWVGAVLNLYRGYGSTEPSWYQSQATWANLMGDPSLWLFTDSPQLLDVECPSTIPLGTRTFTATVTSTSSPLLDAWVTLYQVDNETGETSVVHGRTDADGMVRLDLPELVVGTAMLTVSSPNYLPSRIGFEVINTGRLGITSSSILDDGTLGTLGDGDGIAEAGETIGLFPTVKNYSDSERTGVVLNALWDDPALGIGEGSVTIGTIAPGSQQTAPNRMLVTINGSAPDGWLAHLTTTIISEEEEFEDIFTLPIVGSAFAYVSHETSSPLHPDVAAHLVINAQNIGGNRSATGTATLISQSPWLEVVESSSDVGGVAPDEQVELGPFLVHANAHSHQGYSAGVYVLIEGNNGRIDTLAAHIPFGTRTEYDPIGPDRYGYYSFDNVDTTYTLAPSYDWVEINPDVEGHQFAGVELPLHDNVEEDDDVVLQDLPFIIQYYGQGFTQLTISANGYLSMGNQMQMNIARNWPIPSPLGPDYTIAPFWDDRTIGPNSGVYVYYDQPGGRFIVEWSGVLDVHHQAPCTFQVIFYDQVDGHVTESGDTNILFQYALVDPTSGFGHDNHLYTTGIENGDQSDGLMCAYWGQFMPGVAEIEEGRAILFTTTDLWLTEQAVIQGTVTSSLDNSPVADALIVAERLEDGFLTSTYSSSEDGGYQFRVPVGELQLAISHTDFSDTTLTPFTIAAEETLTVDISLTPLTSIGDPARGELPVEYSIASLHPNPFNPTLTVVVGLPESSNLMVEVVNVMGRRIATLTRGEICAGYHNLIFDGTHASSGVYFVRAIVPGRLTSVKKVVLLK